jgi:metal-sulfur cluster biosynthetic enzyme
MTDNRIGRIKDELRRVVDPELGHNIVDLGFIYDICMAGDVVRISMTATTPLCPATSMLRDAVAERAARVEGIRFVNVEMTFEPPWTPTRIDPEIRASLGFAAIN